MAAETRFARFGAASHRSPIRGSLTLRLAVEGSLQGQLKRSVSSVCASSSSSPNLAPTDGREPRTMPWTAIAQIAKLIGQELESGAGPSEQALATGPMLAEAGATTEIVERLFAEAQRKRPN